MKNVLFLFISLLMLLSCSKSVVETPIVSVDIKDIEMYYGFDKSKDIYEALELVESITTEKIINSKKIKVNKAVVLSSDDKKGTFKLEISGIVNGQGFTKEYLFTDFAESTTEMDVVTTSDIEAYYDFDKSKSISVALELVKNITSEKVINSKKIKVNKAIVLSSDDKKGTFKLDISGTVNGQAFTKEYLFTGFAGSPIEVDVVETSDIEVYYAFDRSKPISVALELIKNTTSEKLVNSKKIKVDEAIVLSSDEQKGSFSLKISGTVNDKRFVKEFAFSGFSIASVILTDYEIGSRAYAQWKVGEEIYLKNFDMDKLLISNDASFYTTQYLSNFVEFYASSTVGLHRQLTPAEVANLTTKDFAYGLDNVITFKTEYKGVTNTTGSRLDFNREKHYSTKITTDRNFVSNLYMRGSFFRLVEFFQGFLLYDRNIYAAELENESFYDNHDNTITLNINFMDKKNGETLSSIHKIISGFKPLSDLSKELLISSSGELEDYMKQKSLTTKDEQTRNALLNATVATWSRKMQISIKRGDGYYSLGWDETNTYLVGNNQVKDVYLGRPTFKVLSSTITGNVLDLKLKLLSVNSESVPGAEFNIKIRNI